MPAPGPGRKRVPRWRTRIIPALTVWPSKILTPSILGFESRPLREDPRPFLCAIYVSSVFSVAVAFGFAAALGFALAAGFFAAGFGLSSASSSSFLAAVRRFFAPIDSISIWVSLLR